MGIIALDSYREAIYSDEHSIARKSEMCNHLSWIRASETTLGLAHVVIKAGKGIPQIE